MKPENKNRVEEPSQEPLYGFVHISEEEKLLREMRKTPMEKLQSFTRMLRRNATLKKAMKQ